MIILGIGTDGHTASLFPNQDILNVKNRIAESYFVDRKRGIRITLTLPTINAGRNILILVSGKDKSEILKKIITADSPDPEYPISLIRPKTKSILWMVDKEAISKI